MKSDKLPTFMNWLEGIRAWKRAIIVALLILGGHALGRNYLKQYYAVILPCDQPCQDGINCDPLELTFEVVPKQIKLGQPYYLWYRARIKNRSCRELHGISVGGFLDSSEMSKAGSHLWVAVVGPDGREIERLPRPQPDGGISWDYGKSTGVAVSTTGTIYPYQANFELIGRLRDSGVVKEPSYVNLGPGESFESIASILRPYRIVATSARDESGGLSDGNRWMQVENPPEFPAPPEGFTLLDRYAFPRSGRYKIMAGFSERLSVYPVFARWDNRSIWLDILFPGIYPSSLDSTDREVNLNATSIIIEVNR